jgi:2-polyprenyl-6-methoxyphenol hydroxylase-like FAD-dependent oxidoreductase
MRNEIGAPELSTEMPKQLSARCAIVGGGPAGMMLGLLVARAGIEVVVLEKHADFLRDFRGDTIHPSTLELMHELGLLEEFLKLPHQEIAELKAWFGTTELTVADFTHLPAHCRFIALMPQWDFLDFLVREARRYPAFRLLMQAEVTATIEEAGRIVGVRARTPQGELEVRADLVIGADGRHSIIRQAAGLTVEELGAPLDVLWFRLPRSSGDPEETAIRFGSGQLLVLLNRGEYWQAGYGIAKGSLDEIHARGLPELRRHIAALAPFVRDRLGKLDDWDKIKLLTVRVDRLRRWYRRGLLCIGDAAHAMSPVGGVGINLAIQDAVAAANVLTEPLGNRALDETHLLRVQRRRELPTRLIQRLQILVQNQVIANVLAGRGSLRPPLLLRVMGHLPWLRRLAARLVGIGIRPEHIRTPARRG